MINQSWTVDKWH